MNQMKHRMRKAVIAVLLLSLGIGVVGVQRLEAASRLAKPRISLQKRTKKTATIKAKNSHGVTGYRVYFKKGKSGKWQLLNIVLHKSKIKLTKLKPGKVYYVKLKAWRTKGSSVQVSPYSKVLKIGKYQRKQKEPKDTPSPSPSPSLAPLPEPTPDIGVTTGGAIVVASPVPTEAGTPAEASSAPLPSAGT